MKRPPTTTVGAPLELDRDGRLERLIAIIMTWSGLDQDDDVQGAVLPSGDGSVPSRLWIGGVQDGLPLRVVIDEPDARA